MNRELIKKEYEENQEKVINLFKWLRKTGNLDNGIFNKGSFLVNDFRPYFNYNNSSKLICSLQDLYTFPNLVNKELTRKIHLFLGKDTVNKHTALNYYTYIVAPAFNYVVLFVEAQRSISYFSWFWLYDVIKGSFDPLQTIDRRKYGLSKIGKLYTFDESIKIIELLKNEWILSNM